LIGGIFFHDSTNLHEQPDKNLGPKKALLKEIGQKYADTTDALMIDHFRIDSNREG